jgi:glycosyltransferase involved in cell wall biosynthesis
VADAVRFLGPVEPEALRVPLSAADLFVLATRNEGWANVFLEAMACGLPVVTTDVGGNREVVGYSGLGALVPFGDPAALAQAVAEALGANWDSQAIIDHARRNSWEARIPELVAELRWAAAPGQGEAVPESGEVPAAPHADRHGPAGGGPS